jgi:alpha-galactosidase
VRIRTELGVPSLRQVRPPGWLGEALKGWVRLPGVVLTEAGLPLPTLDPAQALLIEVHPIVDPT